MPSRRVIITRRALRDLEAIWEYISDQAGNTVASNVIAALLEAMNQLADMPGMGHTRNDVTNPAYRFWSVSPSNAARTRRTQASGSALSAGLP